MCRALGTGGVIGKDVYIVPFGNQPTVMTDYRFEAKLVVAAGGARSIDATPVYSDELGSFRITKGSAPSIEHSPAIRPDPKRELVGAYAIAFLGFNHAPIIRWMPLAEIEAIRVRSREWNPQKHAKCPPWYACKTAIRQVCKLLPDSPKLRPILAQMRDEEAAELAGEAEFPVEAPAARPATVDADGVDLEYESEPKPTRDATWAATITIPFGEQKGKPLGDVRSVSYLNAMGSWAQKQAELPEGFAGARDLIDAVAILLPIRKAEREAEKAAQAAAEVPVAPDAGEVFKDGSTGPVLPGEVEHHNAARGELPLGDAPAKPRDAVRGGR